MITETILDTTVGSMGAVASCGLLIDKTLQISGDFVGDLAVDGSMDGEAWATVAVYSLPAIEALTVTVAFIRGRVVDPDGFQGTALIILGAQTINH